jgi:outer membrane protein assembly factor BamB
VASTRPEELLARVDLESGKVLGRLKLVSGRVSGLTVSADGGTCLALDRDDVFQVVPMTSGKAPWAVDRTPDRAGAPSGVAGPDGQRLYLTGVGRTAARYAHDDPAPDVHYEVEAEATFEGLARWHRSTTGQPTCIAVSADETAVAVGTRAGHLYVYAASTGKLAQQFRLSGRVRALAFSTHGRVLAVGTHDGTVVLIPLKG